MQILRTAERSAGCHICGSCVNKGSFKEGGSDPRKDLASQQMKAKACVWKLPGSLWHTLRVTSTTGSWLLAPVDHLLLRLTLYASARSANLLLSLQRRNLRTSSERQLYLLLFNSFFFFFF